MASLSKAGNGTYTVQFVGQDGKRRSVRLGKVNKRTASEVRTKVEHLHASNVSKLPLDTETSAWIAAIGDDLADKLASVGLIKKRENAAAVTLQGFISRYVASKSDARPRSVINYNQAAKKLYERFGAYTPMRDVTPMSAEAWVSELRKAYAPATVARLIKFARQFYRAAGRVKVVSENPFLEVKAGSMTNASRIRFVSREEIERVLDACPDGQWRLIIALARYGGLRCPSELITLTWNDIDWANHRFLVTSTKTARHADGGRRFVPLFPELRVHLEAEFDQAEPGAVHVIRRTRSFESNLRTGFERIILRAGLIPWPRLFQNLRASRETELAKEYPLHVATSWIGNSAAIASKHYLSVTESDFLKAANAVQNAVQTGADLTEQDATSTASMLKKSRSFVLSPDVSRQYCTSEYTRQESNSSENGREILPIDDHAGAESGAVGDGSLLTTFVATLTPEQRAAFLAILGQSR